MSVSPKINHLTHNLLYCIRLWGHPLPTCAKNLCPPLLCKQAPNTQPCYIASVCGSLTLLFLEKNPDLFPRPKFCSCKVHTHATEISQLKLMGNVAYVCISKNKPLNPYPVVLYKIVGPPPPHLCKKICVLRFGRLGRRWQQVAIHASGNPPTKVNGKYSVWPIRCKQAQTPKPVILHQFVAAWPCYFWRKIQTFCPDQNWARVSPCYRNLPTKINGECCLCLYLKK